MRVLGLLTLLLTLWALPVQAAWCSFAWDAVGRTLAGEPVTIASYGLYVQTTPDQYALQARTTRTQMTVRCSPHDVWGVAARSLGGVDSAVSNLVYIHPPGKRK